MSSESFDAAQFTETQRQSWSSVAAGWGKWWQTFEAGAQHLSDRLLTLAQVQPGQRVLDIATGGGEPALSAARAVGPDGRVLATDLSPQMLALARERAAAHGLENIKFHEMDAAAFDLDGALFDAVLCRWALMLMVDPVAVLRNVRGVLAPAGRFAGAVWDTADKVPFISLPGSVLNDLFDLPASPSDAPGPFRLADRDLLAQTFREAGFEQVEIEPVTVTFVFTSLDEYFGLLQDVSPGMRKVMQEQTPEQQERAWAALADAVNARFAMPDGQIRIPNQSICVVGY